MAETAREEAEKAIRELEREIPDAYAESASEGPIIVLSKSSAEAALSALRTLLSVPVEEDNR